MWGKPSVSEADRAPFSDGNTTVLELIGAAVKVVGQRR